MTTNFPTSLDALTNPTGASSLTSPDHAGQHADANDAIEALEAKVGVNGSAVTTSLDYKITNGIMSSLNVDSGTLVVDAINNRVGVGTASPSQTLDVNGNARISGNTTTVGNLTVNGNILADAGTVKARVISGWDAIALEGRYGGSMGYTTFLNPGPLTTDRYIAFPNTDGTAITTGNLSDITSTGTLSSLTVTGDVVIDSATLRVDSTNNRVGVNNATPQYALDTVGTTRSTDYYVGSGTKSLPRGIIDYKTSSTSDAAILTEKVILTSTTFTAVAGRIYRITCYEPQISTPATSGAFIVGRIRVSGLTGTVLNSSIAQNPAVASGVNFTMTTSWVGTLTAGSQYIVYTLAASATSNATRSSTGIAYLSVEDLGTV